MIKRDEKGRFMKGSKHSEEFKSRSRIRTSLLFKGKPKTQEHKNNISLALKEWNKKNKHSMLGRHHTEESKDKMRFANSGEKSARWGKKMVLSQQSIDKIKKARAKQILPVKDTTIEIKIQNFLKQLGIEYFTHQYMKIEHGYQCDILIPSMNLVIECDGDYWHKYPIGREIDDIRTQELLDKGFKVIRLWENEIRPMKINNFRNKILKGGIL